MQCVNMRIFVCFPEVQFLLSNIDATRKKIPYTWLSPCRKINWEAPSLIVREAMATVHEKDDAD